MGNHDVRCDIPPDRQESANRTSEGKQTYVVGNNVEEAVIAIGLLVETIPDVVFGDEMTGTWM